MCDESFSINCSVQPPEGIDPGWFMFFVTLFNQIYWVTGAALGGLLGSLISFDTEGLEFVMTAMFVVIFLEQWLKERKHDTALIGIVASTVCLLLFGADAFLLPTMACILFLLTVFRKPIEKAGERAWHWHNRSSPSHSVHSALWPPDFCLSCSFPPGSRRPDTSGIWAMPSPLPSSACW